MKELALKVGDYTILAPDGVPTGGIASFEIFSQGLFTILIIISILLALLFLIFGGVRWITSGGEKEGVESARKMITFAIVGLIVVLLTATIINFVGQLFGLNIIGQTSKSTGELKQELDCTRRGICPSPSSFRSNPTPTPACDPFQRQIGEC